jgi:hypothetical protein
MNTRAIGFLLVLCIAGWLTRLGPDLLSAGTPLDTAAVARAVVVSVRERAAGAAGLRLAEGGAALVIERPEGDERLNLHDGRLVAETPAGIVAISPDTTYLSDLRFAVADGRVTPSFAIAERLGFLDGVVQASAAYFDSDILASATGTYKLGAAPADWASINNTLFFSSDSFVAVASSTVVPTSRLEVVDGDLYVDTAGYGLILREPSLKCWRVVASAAATVATSEIACP